MAESGAQDFIESLDHAGQLPGRRVTQERADALDGERSDLADLHP